MVRICASCRSVLTVQQDTSWEIICARVENRVTLHPDASLYGFRNPISRGLLYLLYLALLIEIRLIWIWKMWYGLLKTHRKIDSEYREAEGKQMDVPQTVHGMKQKNVGCSLVSILSISARREIFRWTWFEQIHAFPEWSNGLLLHYSRSCVDGC